MLKTYDFLFKLLLIGDSGVDKTTVLRLFKDAFNTINILRNMQNNSIAAVNYDPRELECSGNVTHEKVMLTGYRPQFDSDEKRDFTDIKLKKLYTLQDFLDNRAPYVTVGMDPKLKVPYGKSVCIPELNIHFRRNIKLQVRDTHEDLAGSGYRRVDICVRTQADSFDDIVNLMEATVVFSNNRCMKG